jgi:hypothetical protein
MHEKLLQFRTDASGCLRSTLVGLAFFSRRTPLKGVGRRALIHESSGSFAPLGPMQLALNLGLELRTLADCALSGVAANRLIDGNIRSPFWLPLRPEEERNRATIVPFLNRGNLTDHG